MAMLKMLLETGALNTSCVISRSHHGRGVRALTGSALHSYFGESLLGTLKHYDKEKWLSHLPRSQFLF